MVEVGGKPIVWHIMKLYAFHDITDFILCLGYKGEMIKSFFLNFHTLTADFSVDLKTGGVTLLTPHHRNWKVSLVNTGDNTGTGGRILRAAPHLADETFMVTYGDGLADVDLAGLAAHHKKMGRIATLTGVRETSRFGVIEGRGTGMVGRFREKPVLDGLISGGFFVFEPAVLSYLDEGPLEGAPLERLAAEKQLALYRHEGYFRCMDTYRDFLELNALYEKGETPWIQKTRRKKAKPVGKRRKK